MNVTKADLIAVLQEEAYRRTSPLANGTPNQELAMEIGKSVQNAMNQLQRMGYLPLGLGMPRDIMVDYDRMRTAPQFVVTVRW